MTISISEKKHQARAVIAALVNAAPDGSLSRTQIYKGFYFAHLMHMQRFGAELSEWPVVRMPHGPGIDRGSDLLDELVQDEVLCCNKTPNGPFVEHRFSVKDMTKADAEIGRLSGIQKLSIKGAARTAGEASAGELSALTHDRSTSWNETLSGATLPIYVDLIEPEEVEDVRDALRHAAEDVRAVFGG